MSLLLIRHVAHLERDVLQPALNRFCPSDHPRDLRPYDRLSDERLSEDLPLSCPFQDLLDDESLCARGRAAHHPALVVEVAQHDVDTCALFPERVSDRHAHVGEGDVGCTRGGRVARLDRLRLDTFAARYENDGEAILPRK